MEDGEIAVGVVVHPDLGAHKMGPAGIGRDLQPASLPRHGVVGGHGALLLDRQDVAPLALGDRHEGRAGLPRGNGEAGVVAGQIVLLEEAVGGLHGGDAGELQLLGQAVLKGAEGPFAAPAGLRRVGRDVLDAELGERPSDLGEHPLATLPPASGVWK